MESRREFLKKIIITGGLLTIKPESFAEASSPRRPMEKAACTLYRAVNGTPDENLRKVIEIQGGIEKIIGFNDVVVIKPNVQWWSQGAPNLSALKSFVEMIMERQGGFKGEVVIAENCHRGKTPWTSMNSGWAHPFERNSDIPGVNNMNDLSNLLKKRFGRRFTTCHLVDVRAGSRRVYGPADGDGYVYCDGTGGIPLIACDNGSRKNYRAAIMTYPIFTTDNGTKIDFKNGIWEKGAYTSRPIRFINFAALNHHSAYCGATSAVKNYMGIVDLSGGPDPHNDGLLTGKYYNFHSFPFDKWSPGPEAGMLGREVGVFLKTIRKADLNITTAEWVGLSSRTEHPFAHTRTALACTDPVALDYHAARYILYPNSKIAIHNPDNKKGPLRQYLTKCAEQFKGVFDERYVEIKSYDFQAKTFQRDADMVISGAKEWGSSLSAIGKYFYLRYLS